MPAGAEFPHSGKEPEPHFRQSDFGGRNIGDDPVITRQGKLCSSTHTRSVDPAHYRFIQDFYTIQNLLGQSAELCKLFNRLAFREHCYIVTVNKISLFPAYNPLP